MQGRNQDLRFSSTLKGQVIVSMVAYSDIALIPSDCCHDMVRLQYSDSENYSNKMIASAAVLVLLLIALLAILMHMYAKRCLLHFGAQRQALWRRWQGIDLAPQEPFRAIGLGGTIIDTLPVFVYKGQKAGEEALECMVCLCEFKENDKGRMLPKCNHSFHIHCIDTWFRLHSTCPLCRTPAGPERAAVAPFDNNPEEVSTQSEASEASEHVEVSEVYARGGLEPPLSLSQLSQENIGIQYPTNILFWGDYTHVNSRISSPEVDCDLPPGDQYVTHTVLDIPRREGVFSNHSILRTSSGCPLTDERASSPIGQPKEFPMAHLKTFKWLLRRERRVSPSDQDEREPEQGAGVSNG